MLMGILVVAVGDFRGIDVEDGLVSILHCFIVHLHKAD